MLNHPNRSMTSSILIECVCILRTSSSVREATNHRGDDRRSVEAHEDDEEDLGLRSSDLRFEPVSVVHERSYFDPGQCLCPPLSCCVRLYSIPGICSYLGQCPRFGFDRTPYPGTCLCDSHCKSVVFLIPPACTFPPPHKHRTLMKAKLRGVTSMLMIDNRTTD